MIAEFDGVRPVIGDNVFIAENAVAAGRVTIGDGASLWYGAVVRADINTAVIGCRTNIQDNAVVHVGGEYPAVIGSNVTIGHGAIVHGCTIEDNVLIGMGSIIMNGAVIGTGSIIGAGALVKENTVIPAGSVAVGSPCRIVKQTSDEQMEMIRRAAEHYAELAGKFRTVTGEQSM